MKAEEDVIRCSGSCRYCNDSVTGSHRFGTSRFLQIGNLVQSRQLRPSSLPGDVFIHGYRLCCLFSRLMVINLSPPSGRRSQPQKSRTHSSKRLPVPSRSLSIQIVPRLLHSRREYFPIASAVVVKRHRQRACGMHGGDWSESRLEVSAFMPPTYQSLGEPRAESRAHASHHLGSTHDGRACKSSSSACSPDVRLHLKKSCDSAMRLPV